MKFLQSRNALIGIIAILIVLMIGGGAWLVMGKNHAQTSNTQSQDGTTSDGTNQDQIVGTLSPADIGLKLSLRDDSKAVKFTADKLSGVKSLEWNFMYQADIPIADQTPDNAGQKVTQEFGSDNPVMLAGKTNYESQFRELGTCSSGHCRYDSGVSLVKIELKVTKDNGNVYKVDDSISL